MDPTHEPDDQPMWRLAPESNRHLRDVVKAAPALNLPRLTSAMQQGKIVEVTKIGHLVEERIVCLETSDKKIYRLPDELESWATSTIALAQKRKRAFPTKIEFGVINGRPYAEFQI